MFQVETATLDVSGAGAGGTPPPPFTNAMPSTGGAKSEGAEGAGTGPEMRDAPMMVDVVDDEPAQWAGLEVRLALWAKHQFVKWCFISPLRKLVFVPNKSVHAGAVRARHAFRLGVPIYRISRCRTFGFKEGIEALHP